MLDMIILLNLLIVIKLVKIEKVLLFFFNVLVD